jgi:hypothetical protein
VQFVGLEKRITSHCLDGANNVKISAKLIVKILTQTPVNNNLQYNYSNEKIKGEKLEPENRLVFEIGKIKHATC